MMKYAFLISVLILVSSCSPTLVPFSQGLYEEYNWSDDELKRIQFYLSDDIVLQRKLGGNESSITEGKIRVIDGVEVEEVLFKKGTPGVLVFSPKSDRFAVSFENDDQGYLMFGPNPKMSRRYALLAKEWNHNYGKVTYKNRLYNTSSRSSYVSLMVDIDKATKNIYKSRTVEGRRIGN